MQKPVPLDEQDRRRNEYESHKEKIKTKQKKIKIYKDNIKRLVEIKEKYKDHLKDFQSESSISSSSCSSLEKEAGEEKGDTDNRNSQSLTHGFLDL